MTIYAIFHGAKAAHGYIGDLHSQLFGRSGTMIAQQPQLKWTSN